MAAPELMIASAGNLLQAFLFAFVGYAMAKRLGPGQVPLAAKTFVAWWYLMAAQGLVVAVMDVGVGLGLGGLLWYEALFGLNILIASAQIWALGYYLIYLWTGRERSAHWWLGLFATAYFVYFMVLVAVAGPTGIRQGTWSTGLDLGLGPTQLAVLGTLFFLPIFGLLSGYFLLAFEIRSETQRVRVIVLGVVAALWNLSLVDRFAADTGEPAPFLGFIAVLNLAWVVVLYLVYFPPKAIRRRLMARRVQHPAPPAADEPAAGPEA